ncbi:STAS domain-containing protein [Micromonospora sp. R77]|uniref:STAS domain-containing protein n=1 Tax=Micromonospora sp. R77 TaxID=2925836 RepID=UPI001F60C971|nr:STAS domain-containing protein [Micromonospora sp. R77]MCI4064623.1 STAS domain-containing protein [Micromonospora sp. R77]
MQIGTQSTEPGHVTLAVHGEIDMASAAELDQALDAVLRRAGVVEIVVDLTEVSYPDSTGVGALLRGVAEAVGRATLRVPTPGPWWPGCCGSPPWTALLGLPDDGRPTSRPGRRGLG